MPALELGGSNRLLCEHPVIEAAVWLEPAPCEISIAVDQAVVAVLPQETVQPDFHVTKTASAHWIADAV